MRRVLPCTGWKNSGGTSSFTSLYFASLHQADDLRCRASRCAADAHVLADRVAPEAELLRERLVHDRDLRRAELSAGVNSRPASSGMPSVWK